MVFERGGDSMQDKKLEEYTAAEADRVDKALYVSKEGGRNKVTRM